MYVRVTFPYCLEAVGRMCKHISTLDTRMEIVSGGITSGQISGVRYRLRWSILRCRRHSACVLCCCCYCCMVRLSVRDSLFPVLAHTLGCRAAAHHKYNIKMYHFAIARLVPRRVRWLHARTNAARHGATDPTAVLSRYIHSIIRTIRNIEDSGYGFLTFFPLLAWCKLNVNFYMVFYKEITATDLI